MYQELLTESNKREVEVEYSDYKDYLQKREILKGIITGEIFHGEFKQPKTIQSSSGLQLDNITHFKLKLPFLDRVLQKNGIMQGLNILLKKNPLTGQVTC